MCKVQLKDLKVGDNISVFGSYEKKKYTVKYAELRESRNKEVVDMLLQSDDGHVKRYSFLPADLEATLWEEDTTSTEFHMEEVARMLSSIANSVEDIEAKSLLMQAVDYVSQAYNSLRKELKQ